MIVSEERLLDVVAAERTEGRTIALANGCFDLLHVGHVRYLAGAAAEADRLVVAINDDRTVAALKGQGRPILPVQTAPSWWRRSRWWTTPSFFSTPTVAELLERVRPDVHCKGTDYTVDTVPEREIVRRYGGRTAIVGDPKDHATRDLFARVAEQLSGRPSARPEANASSPKRNP